jgi:hypothetical protein
MKKTKKAQEEIIGFVLIMVVVAVAFLIFLGITIRNSDSPEQKDSVDTSHFLDSLMEYTTECAIVSTQLYSNMAKLIKDCDLNKQCQGSHPQGALACEILEETLTEILSAGWKIGENTPIKGYTFAAKNSAGETIEKSFISKRTGSTKGCSIKRGTDKAIGEGRVASFFICLN